MIVLSLLSLLLAAPALGQQIVYDTAHNVTSIVGTWASGSQKVLTGLGFAQPANLSFIYPTVTGIAYSFSSDGYYEISRYRMNGNGTQPNCITGVMNWCHGTYQLLPNGSILATPFGDGYQQIQDPCAPQSNFIETYNDTELYSQWIIFQDATKGYTLQLYEEYGTPLPPMYQVTGSPVMLPTQLLRNVSSSTNGAGALATNAGERHVDVSKVMCVLSLVAGLGMASWLL